MTFNHGMDLQSDMPHLYKSRLRIHVYYMPHDNPDAQLLCSMKLSASGSIRKAYNVMEIVGAFRSLQEFGSGPFNMQGFVRNHNMNTTSDHQIVGA